MPSTTPYGAVASGHFDVSDAQFITGGCSNAVVIGGGLLAADQAIVGGIASALHIPGGQLAKDQTISGGMASALVVPSDTLALAGGSGAVGSITGGGIQSTVIGSSFLGNAAPQNIWGIQPGAEAVTYGSAGSMTGDGQPSPSTGTNNYLYHKQIMIDGTPLVGNKIARMRNDNNLTWGVASPAGKQPIANVEVYTDLPYRIAGGGINVFLDYSALESCLNNSSPAPMSGANAIWLANGGLCAIYKQRDTTSDAWSYWYRVNNMGGYQDGTPQPAIVNGAIGNWSARQAISVPTTDWLQICRGQDRVVALYNTGTLQINQQPPSGYGGEVAPSVYTPMAGNLCAIYALDGGCTTWSDPVVIASNVRPIMGGLCWTGGEWVAVYTRMSDQVCVAKRSRSLLDWASSVETDTNVFRPAEITPYPGQIPARRLHCYGLCYDERNTMHGYWAAYDDTPTVYATVTNVFGTYPQEITYGQYISVTSPDQGRTWILNNPAGRSGGSRLMGGNACMVDGAAYVMDVSGNCTWSCSCFQNGDNGTYTF